jgi:D-alanyl-lipoteichoic acid acyltransferase DltB (MBOAT superfamily)
LIIFFFLIFLPLLIEAIEFKPPWQTKSFQELLDAIYNFVFWVAIAIVPIMIIVAAFYFLTSGGDPEKVRTAKRVIFWTFIGLIIVLSSKGISSIIEFLSKGAPSGLTSAKLSQLGDINGDCIVDISDIGSISKILGAKPGDPNWDPKKDLNKNNEIDICDVSIASNSFGFGCD